MSLSTSNILVAATTTFVLQDHHYDSNDKIALNSYPVTDCHPSYTASHLPESSDQSTDLPFNNESYITTVRRQNFRLGVLLLPVMVIAYFLIRQPFTRSDWVSFGGDSSMKGLTGVAFATNKTQEITAPAPTIIRNKGHIDDVKANHDNMGDELDSQKEWMFNKNNHHLDELMNEERAEGRHWKGSSTKKDSPIQAVEGYSAQSPRKYDTQKDVDLITKKLAGKYDYYGPGFGKNNFPELENLGSALRGKKHYGHKKTNRSNHR